MPSTLALADVPFNENSMPDASIKLRPYRPGDAEAFRLLNEAWIEKYFGIEEADQKVLHDPDGYILARGGHIFFGLRLRRRANRLARWFGHDRPHRAGQEFPAFVLALL